MSIRNFLTGALTVIVGGVIGYTTVKSLQQPRSSERNLASIAIGKLAGQQYARSLIDVQLHLGELAKKDSDVSHIRITVTGLKDISPGLSYRWVVPPEVRVVAGTLNSDVGAIAAGETKEFWIDVVGFSKEMRRYMSFEVVGQQNSFPVKSEALISSRVEDSIEYLVQQSELKRQSNGFNKLDNQKRRSKFSPENIVK